MPWQIQVRRKIDGQEWEPISVERELADSLERQYHYESLDEVKLAWAKYMDIQDGLPNLIVRKATGRPKFTDTYDVRFVAITEAVPPGSESDWAWTCSNCQFPNSAVRQSCRHCGLKRSEAERGVRVGSKPPTARHAEHHWDTDPKLTPVPPGSESAALRGKVEQPPAEAYEHHGLPTGHYWVWYEGDWIIGDWDGEDWNLANGVTTSSRHVLRGPLIADPPTSGPPTPGLAELRTELHEEWKLLRSTNHRLLAALKTLMNAMDPNTDPDPRGLDELLRIGQEAIARAFEWAQPDNPPSTSQNAERQACIADIKAAFWGDEYITDRYDIAQFILDRIAKREEKENA